VLHEEKCLASFLSNYTEFGGVVLQWRLFSPIGVPYHDMKKTYFEQYQYTVEDAHRHVKSIVQPKYVKEMALHQKICGLNNQRNEYRNIRISMLSHVFNEGSLHRETSLPLIHNDLVEIMSYLK